MCIESDSNISSAMCCSVHFHP